MTSLAIDTATDRACVALVRDAVVLAERAQRAPRSQTEDLIPLIDDTLRAAGVDRREVTEVVVGVGPGPFTGLRVGIVTGVMLAEGLGIPVYGVHSLDACAGVIVADGSMQGEFNVSIDAKRGEVFWARYTADGTRIAGPFVGKDVDALSGVMSAAALAVSTERVPPRPVYLREPDATIPGAPKKVTP